VKRAYKRGALALLVIAVGLCAFHIVSVIRAKHHGHHRHYDAVVVIDPGHPSETNSGRHHVNCTSELDINWDVALKLQSLLGKDTRLQVIRARGSRDQFQLNHDRARIANDAHANLTIHLHCDAGPSHGYTIYYPDREGHAEGQTGPTEKVLHDSRKLAYTLHGGMAQALTGSLHDRGVKGETFTRIGRINGGLTVSIFSQVPTVTVEMVFLNNRSDAQFIKSEAGQERMAHALARGIVDYLVQTGALRRTAEDGRSGAASP
jgi:N-acetylmuramoyl-L-alanine amidase